MTGAVGASPGELLKPLMVEQLLEYQSQDWNYTVHMKVDRQTNIYCISLKPCLQTANASVPTYRTVTAMLILTKNINVFFLQQLPRVIIEPIVDNDLLSVKTTKRKQNSPFVLSARARSGVFHVARRMMGF